MYSIMKLSMPSVDMLNQGKEAWSVGDLTHHLYFHAFMFYISLHLEISLGVGID